MDIFPSNVDDMVLISIFNTVCQVAARRVARSSRVRRTFTGTVVERAPPARWVTCSASSSPSSSDRARSTPTANVADGHPTVQSLLAPSRRAVLHRRVRWLVATTIAYNLAEAAVAISAGAIASSTALLGFGLDPLIEVSSAAAA